MKKFEYRTDTNFTSSPIAHHALGLEGWELVSVIYSDNLYTFFYKREIISTKK